MSSVARFFLLLACFLLARTAMAQEGGLRPPCGASPEPPYAAPGAAPTIQKWSEGDLRPPRWLPAACLGWSGQSRLAVALAGEFALAGGLDGLLWRIGGFSHYREIPFWSMTRGDWQPLVREAGLLPTGGSTGVGTDAPPDQFVSGRSFDYYEVDSAGRSTYRMTVRERTPDRVVLAIENTSTIRLSLMPLFDPHALQSVLFLDRHEGNRWGYYQALRAADGTSLLALSAIAPYINRMTAFYRYVAGQQVGTQSAASPRGVR